MLARAALVALVAAVLAAPAAGASRERVLVTPGAPVVGKHTTIEVRTAAKLARLSVRIVSPTSHVTVVPLRRVSPGLWRVGYKFVDDGQWLLHVLPGTIVASVWVQQPPAGLPPFRPSGSQARPSVSGILGQGTFVFP